MPQSSDSKRTFKILSRKEKYRNSWMNVVEFAIERDGEQGTYGVVNRPNAATIIALTKDDRLLMLKQYRFPTESYSWELPMGAADNDESFLDAATRELREETGLDAELEAIGSFRPIPGLTPQRVEVFYTEIPDELIPKLETFKEDVDEIVNRRLIPRDDLANMIATEEISDGFTLCSLSLFYLTSCRFIK